MSHSVRRRKLQGSILLDGLVGAFIVALASVSYFTMFPMVRRTEVRATQETRAIQIANRLIEHLQLLKPANVNAPTLTQLNLIDPGQVNSPFTFSNIPLDEGSLYSPAQSLPGGQGTMTVTPLAGSSVMVQIEISWDTIAGRQRYRSGTVIGGYR